MTSDFGEEETLSGISRNFLQQEANRITVCNTGSTELAGGSAGKVGTWLHRDSENQADLFAVSPAVDDEDPWGILAAPLAPGEIGELILTGVVPAKIVQNGAGTRVHATSEGLKISYQGRGELLSFSGSGEVPSTILLGTLCGTEYNGYFKLIPTGGGVKIVNGRNPESSLCGYTDLPGCTNVPATEFESWSGMIYLNATHDADGYHVSFGTYNYTTQMSIAIGYVRPLSVDQQMTESTACFGRRFFL